MHYVGLALVCATIPCLTFIDGGLVVVGGQHLVAASLDVLKLHPTENKYDVLRNIQVTMLKCSCPPDIRRLLTGQHQEEQGGTSTVKWSDMAALWNRCTVVHGPGKEDEWEFTDRLWYVLRACGVVKPDKKNVKQQVLLTHI